MAAVMRSLEVRRSFTEAVHVVVQHIPRGRVATYADVAMAVGRPGAARAVGQVMRTKPDTKATPCHRVVSSTGMLGGYNGSDAVSPKKMARLKEEGVRVLADGTVVDFAAVRWVPPLRR